jgi:dTDP-4-amino-4,6-dideoxygalactose transaminase
MSEWRVPLTEVSLSEGDVDAVLETLRSGWLTMGPRTQELERAFAAYAEVEHTVAVSSGTAALHLALLALGVGPGDEVIVPALSFVADAHTPRCCGAEPVLADSTSLDEPLLDPDSVAQLIGPRTKAVIAVHMFGYPADWEPLDRVCEEAGVALVEDCAEAVGGRHRDGAMIGTKGAAGCFSFFSKTQLGAGEGGIVISPSAEVADRVRSLRSHAMTSVTWERHRGHAETYDVTDLGFNYRIDEPRATLARSRLERLDTAIDSVRGVVRSYRELLDGVDGVDVPFDDAAVERGAHFAFPVVVGDRATRDAVRDRLRAEGVQTTCYPALGQLTEYAAAAERHPTPVSAQLADCHLCLPLSPSLDQERIELVVEALRGAVESPG